MSEARNIVTARFAKGNRDACVRDLVWQYDYGLTLQFEGIELPDAYETHFSNALRGGTAKTVIGGADGVCIPDEYLAAGTTVYAWIYLHAGEDDGETVYSIMIPVKARAKPTNEAPTPQERSAISETIAALQAANGIAVAAMNESFVARDTARMFAEDAEAARNSAAGSEVQARLYADKAEEGFTGASTAAADARQSAALAALSAGGAKDERDSAEAARNAAEQYRDEAGASLETLEETIGSALRAAKDSGEFDGPKGDRGDDGITPRFSIGAVATLAPGTDATVSLGGTDAEPVLSFGLPQGPRGETGDPGYTPVRGVDYWTEADVDSVTAAAIEAVLDAYPTAEEVEW